MPDICIASDFIVGFPTETDDDFRQTVELLRQCRFKNSFIFKYSPRPGTAAIDRFDDDVPEPVKRDRNNQLLAAQQEVSEELNAQMVGQEVEVLVEGPSKLRSRPPAGGGAVELAWEIRNGADSNAHSQLVARTRGDQVVVFDGAQELAGKILKLKIADARNMTLFGRQFTD